MPISRRYLITSTLILLLIGAGALLCLVGATVWLSLRAQNYAALVNEQRLIRSHALSVREALLAAESSQRGYVLTSNEIYLAPYENAKLVARSELALLETDLRTSSRFQRMMPRLTELVDQRLHDLDTVIERKNAQGLGEALALIGTNQGKALMDEVFMFLAAIVLNAEDALETGLQEQTTNITALRIGAILASLLVILVVTGVVTVFVRHGASWRRRVTNCRSPMPAWRCASRSGPRTWCGRGTGRKSCWRKSITASPTAFPSSVP